MSELSPTLSTTTPPRGSLRSWLRHPSWGVKPIPTTPLEAMRICLAMAFIGVYGLLGHQFDDLYGLHAWIPIDQVQVRSVLLQPLLDVFRHSWFVSLVHVGIWLFGLALLFGWRTSWVKWVVLLIQLALVVRNPYIRYGVDNIMSSLLLLLCLAPVGRQWSLDRVRQLRLAKRQGLMLRPVPKPSAWAQAVLWLVQWQMAILFFYAGVEKLFGHTWWQGIAVWRALANYEYDNGALAFFAEHFWLVNLLTYGSVLLEIGFAFLIWQRITRPLLLLGAVALHLGIAVFLGLYAFSFTMLCGHLAFVRQSWWDHLGAWLRQQWLARIGRLEMIYDGDCGFCQRSMQVFLAFDGMGHIQARDFRTNPSPWVSHKAMEKALHLLAWRPHSQEPLILGGFEAYRYVVLRVPGQWWMVPLFYVPFFSRWIGTPVYNWIALRRGTISTYVGNSDTACALPPPK